MRRSTQTASGNGEAHAAPHVPDADMYLVFELERRAYALREAFTIGRDTGSDLVVLEPTVSRTHARISGESGTYFLESIGPTGTKVNGARLEQPHQLAYGDRVEIGTVLLTVRTNPLPLGVTIADKPLVKTLDAVAARRPTIRHPLMADRIVERPHSWGKWAMAIAALAIGALLFLRG